MKKTIIVTGVTGGIGSQIARKFILMGDIVIGVYNNSESVAMQLKKEFGANLLYINVIYLTSTVVRNYYYI